MEPSDSQASRAARHGRGRGGCGLGGSKDSNVNNNVNNCSSVDVSSLFCYYTNVDSLSNKWDEFCAGIKNMGREPDIIMLTEGLPKTVDFNLQKQKLPMMGMKCFQNRFQLI